MNKCPFCGSEKIRIPTPYLVHGEKQYTYCCLAQKKNATYIEEHTSRQTGEEPKGVDRW